MTNTDAPRPHAADHDDDESARREIDAALAARVPVWKPLAAAIVLVAGTGALVALGAVPRIAGQREVEATKESLARATRRVQFVTAKLAAASRKLTLPATLRADASADLVAQTSGYVTERRADIGDRVRAGDLLAVIDAPVVEQELARARAALAEAEAAQSVLAHDETLARTTLERWRSVEPPGAVSKQELDERASALESARSRVAAGAATIASRRAEVEGLARQQGFARVVAPFDGTIVARELDVGDYVGAGATPRLLFRIVDARTLRAYIDVPQSWASSVKAGANARVLLKERPGATFAGSIARTSGALDERTRTLRVEVRIPNESGELLAGTYAQVELELARDTTPVVVPGASLLIRAEGPRVATLDETSALHYRSVVIGRDLGSEVELASGISAGERVVVNMADELPEGTQVEASELPAPQPPKPATPPASAPKDAPKDAQKDAPTKTPGAAPADAKAPAK